jgi:hypothetical protein
VHPAPAMMTTGVISIVFGPIRFSDMLFGARFVPLVVNAIAPVSVLQPIRNRSNRNKRNQHVLLCETLHLALRALGQRDNTVRNQLRSLFVCNSRRRKHCLMVYPLPRKMKTDQETEVFQFSFSAHPSPNVQKSGGCVRGYW